MSYGDFSMQIKERGAVAIVAAAAEKTTQFVYAGETWMCAGKDRAAMAHELADGYEMPYCLALYCSRLPDGTPAAASES